MQTLFNKDILSQDIYHKILLESHISTRSGYYYLIWTNSADVPGVSCSTFELSILNDITPFSTRSYINLGVTVCLRELLKYASGFKVLETLPGMSIPGRIRARKAE